MARASSTTRLRARLARRLRGRQRVRRLTGLGGRLEAGDHTYFDAPPRVTSYAGDTHLVRLGRFCSVARDVEFVVGGNHRTEWITTYPLRVMFGLPGALRDGHPWSKGDVEVGSDVWIGLGACVMSGVHVGDGAVIAAHAVVTSDVRPYAIVAGNPAREVRRRFDDEAVETLLALRWWDWPLERVLANVDVLSGSDVDALRAIKPAS